MGRFSETLFVDDDPANATELPMSGCETIPGWWFGTFFIFPYSGNNHPNFSEGFKPPTSIVLPLFLLLYWLGETIHLMKAVTPFQKIAWIWIDVVFFLVWTPFFFEVAKFCIILFT